MAQLLFLADEDVPHAVVEFLRHRGDNVLSVGEEDDLRGSTDAVLAALADRDQRIIITWNHKDFKQLIRRDQPKGAQRLKYAASVSFVGVDKPDGVTRLREFIGLIEFEWSNRQGKHDTRIIVRIQKAQVSFVR